MVIGPFSSTSWGAYLSGDHLFIYMSLYSLDEKDNVFSSHMISKHQVSPKGLTLHSCSCSFSADIAVLILRTFQCL